MNFVFFLVLNGIMLIRPEELFPEIAGLRLYLIAIVLCVAASLDELKRFASAESLANSPVSVCVLAYFLATIVSMTVAGRFGDAITAVGPGFAKVILYYALMVSLVTDESRFRATIVSLALFILIVILVALAQHLGLAYFVNITPCPQNETDRETGEYYVIYRLVGAGIFNDPNDLCLLIGLGILCCVHLACHLPAGPAFRLFFLVLIPVFAYALTETHSRGGLMGVMAGFAGYLYSRFGGPRALPFLAVGLLGALAMTGGGRQADFSGGGTAHERLMLWADGLTNLFNRPEFLLTGLGDGWYVENHVLVAHNSFVQAYVEQGLLGGAAFLGSFVYAAWMTDRIGRSIPAPDWVVQARPFVFGAVCAYAVGCYSLTRNLLIPTYLLLGLAAVVTFPREGRLPAIFQVDRRWFVRMLFIGVSGMASVKVTTQLLGMAGI